MTDQPDTLPTPEEKAAAAAVMADPDYLEGDDEATRDDAVTEEAE